MSLNTYILNVINILYLNIVEIFEINFIWIESLKIFFILTSISLDDNKSWTISIFSFSTAIFKAVL